MDAPAVLVTGGTSGIGQCVAELLSASGWRVHVAPALIVGNTAIAGPPLEIVLR